MSFTPRWYQTEAIDAGAKFLLESRGQNGLMVLPTGSGKSICIAGTIAKLGAPTLVFQPSKEILTQNAAKYRAYGYGCGIYSASAGEKRMADVTFATIGSVVRKQHLLERFKYVIVDECHFVNSEAGQYEEVLGNMGVPVLGMTATPYRLAQGMNPTTFQRYSILKFLTRTRPRIFDKVVYSVQNRVLFDEGYLAKLQYYSIKVINRNALQRNSTGADYTDESLRQQYAMNDMPGKVVKVVRRLFEIGRKNVLVFTRFTEEARYVVSQIPGAAIVTADTPPKERDRVIRGFRDGWIKCVCNVGILCLDDQTEILTKEGWVGIDSMTKQHNVACWSMDGSIRFAPPKKVIQRDRMNGEEMVSAKGNAIDFRVTGGHTMVRSAGRDNYWARSRAIDLVGKRFQFPSTGSSTPDAIVPEDRLITSKQFARKVVCTSYNYRKKGMTAEDARRTAEEMTLRKSELSYTPPSLLSLDDCRLIGFWLGDGTVYRGRYSIVQSNVYHNIVSWFDGVISRIGIHHSRGVVKAKKGSYMTDDAVIWNFARGTGGLGQAKDNGCYRLEPYLKKKGTPLLWGLSRDQYMALLEGFWYADGEHGVDNEFSDSSTSRWRITGTQKPLFDLLQAIGTCRGIRSTLRPVKDPSNPKHLKQWRWTFKETDRTSIGTARPVVEANYKAERVWCVESETGYIVTRRNGIVTIMGNCTGFDYPELEAVVMARPTMSLALWYQIVGRGIRPHPSKEYTMIVDMGGNLEQFGKVEDLTLSDQGGWHIHGADGRLLTGVPFGDKPMPRMRPA
jgi:DNA repair protein RadD